MRVWVYQLSSYGSVWPVGLKYTSGNLCRQQSRTLTFMGVRFSPQWKPVCVILYNARACVMMVLYLLMVSYTGFGMHCTCFLTELTCTRLQAEYNRGSRRFLEGQPIAVRCKLMGVCSPSHELCVALLQRWWHVILGAVETFTCICTHSRVVRLSPVTTASQTQRDLLAYSNPSGSDLPKQAAVSKGEFTPNFGIENKAEVLKKKEG